MRLSAGATDLMKWLTEQYIATSNGNYEVWNFTPHEGDQRIVELTDLGLVKPIAARRGPHRLTAAGHQWVMDNRKLEGKMNGDEDFFFPDTFLIGDVEYKGQRGPGKKEAIIPCTGAPEVNAGDVIRQKSGRGHSELRVLDVHFREGGTLGMSGHRDMLTLTVENMTASQHASPRTGGLNIGAINASAVMVGDGNVQNVNITLQELVQQIARSGDADSKGLLARLLNNASVGGIVGAGVTVLLELLKGH